MFAGIKPVAIAALLSFSWLSSAQAVPLNLDFGYHFDYPNSDFGAASGQTGVWNYTSYNFVTTGLVDTSGAATGASVNITASTMFGQTSASGSADQSALMNDYFHSEKAWLDSWSFSISGLSDGLYDVYVYAPPHRLVGTGAGSVNGVSFGDINGEFSGTFIEGSNYHMLTSVQVVAGLLTASGSHVDHDYSGISGLQLVPVSPVPVPAALPLFLAGLAGFGYIGWRKNRRAAQA